jgi:predicted nucleic acid-binding protein
VKVDYPGLEQAIPANAVVALDASVTLAYLSGAEAASAAATWLFDGCLATGRNAAVMSTLTVAELLVRPFRVGASAVASVEGFLRFFSGIRIADVSYPIAREAGRIRATTTLKIPDAIVLATAAYAGATVVVTNDRGWPASVSGAAGPTIVQIGRFVRS